MEILLLEIPLKRICSFSIEVLQNSPDSGWNVCVERKIAACLTDGECIARTRVSYQVFYGFIFFWCLSKLKPCKFLLLAGQVFLCPPSSLFVHHSFFSSVCLQLRNSDLGSCMSRFVLEEPPFSSPLFFPGLCFPLCHIRRTWLSEEICILHYNWQIHPRRKQISSVFGCTK